MIKEKWHQMLEIIRIDSVVESSGLDPLNAWLNNLTPVTVNCLMVVLIFFYNNAYQPSSKHYPDNMLSKRPRSILSSLV
ncbi:MAG: hypothetical protein HNEKOMLI_00493 [Sodalis sp. Psp]|nr:hypothetical protein [Sodalis sp. Psp]MCR3756965.1 hypothetical protein [Sodalis sp. Ppy]